MSSLTEVFKAHKLKRDAYKESEVNFNKSNNTDKKSNWKKPAEPSLFEKSIIDTVIGNLNILILDTDADSLNPKQANLFQVSMHQGNFSSGEWSKTAYRVESAKMSNHFILSLEGGEDLFPDNKVLPLDEVMSNVIDAFNSSDLVIAYNSSYHIQLLACEAKRAGMELPPIHILDPFTIYSTAYKYSRGKKLTDAIKKYGSDIGDFGLPGFYFRTPTAIKWLVEQMAKDSNCESFFNANSLNDLTKEQVMSSAMNYINLKEFFAKQSNGKSITWNPWPMAPGDSQIVPEGLAEVVPELREQFSSEPEERPLTEPISFNYFSNSSLFQSIALGLFTTEEEATPFNERGCSIVSFLEGDNLTCIVEGKNSDSISYVVSEMNKFPLTSLGVKEQVFEISSTSKDNDNIIVKLTLSQK